MSDITLYAIKPRFVASLHNVTTWCASHGVKPNTVTLWAVPVAGSAGLVLIAGTHHPAAWLAVAPLLLCLMAINAVDGALARLTGLTTTRGAVINEAVDRFGDAAILLPGFLLAPGWVAGAALATTVASEIAALLAWGATGRRGLVGLMGKPDRALVVSAAAICAFFLGSSSFAYAYLLIGAGGLATVAQRIIWTVRHVR
ncbi:MAG TPA: CDP-alcohol phosphatidyltransferase family protein [Gemmatimonadales bacterium]|nr:CDP-alcohol phosphatidyltransferase family protein [Gemmatimonadales bacterium]